MTTAAPRRNSVAALFVAVAMALPLGLPAAQANVFTGFTQAVAEMAASDEAIAAFYRERQYEPLWTGEGAAPRREALLRALSQADAHGLPSARYRPEEIAAAFRAARGEREIGILEVETTRMFLSYAQDISSGALEPTRILPAEIKRDLPRRDRLGLLTGFAASESPAAYLRDLAPHSAAYARLMREKARLERLIVNGGWGAEVSASSLKPEDQGDSVIALRNRLVAMGYLARSASASYDPAMTAAVRAFQSSHGLEESGIASGTTLSEVNRTAEDRPKSVIVALERERWMNFEDGLGARHVWVNLVDFRARVVDDGKVSFETRAVVGERVQEHQTYEFSDMMEYLEVNPDWTVPRSIIGREYLPRLRNNPNAASHLQIIDVRGRVVPREAVDWSQFSATHFPFTMRQPPGRGNALRQQTTRHD
jgi:murein L,D-transpeptidase YcbB/YkuD